MIGVTKFIIITLSLVTFNVFFLNIKDIITIDMYFYLVIILVDILMFSLLIKVFK